MNKRKRHMQRYNALRSARVEAMLEMLNAIDHGAPELEVLTGKEDNYILENELNSYRAMKVAQYFKVNVSKGKLTRFSKPEDHHYHLTAKQLMDYIEENHDAFVNYWEWYRQPAIHKVEAQYTQQQLQILIRALRPEGLTKVHTLNKTCLQFKYAYSDVLKLPSGQRESYTNALNSTVEVFKDIYGQLPDEQNKAIEDGLRSFNRDAQRMQSPSTSRGYSRQVNWNNLNWCDVEHQHQFLYTASNLILLGFKLRKRY